MTQFQAIILAALALHIVVLATLAVLVLRYRRRWQAATERADSNARFANGAVAKLTDVNANFRSLENTLADTSRLLTDAQGTIGMLEQRVADADPQRDVALSAGRASHARIHELELNAIDVEAKLAAAQQEVVEGSGLLARLTVVLNGTSDLLSESNRQCETLLDQNRRYADTVHGLMATIADLEARLRLPEPTPADLVLLDAAVRPEQLHAMPEGCRVEVMPYRPHAVLRGPKGRFVRLKAAEQDNAESAL